MEQSTPIIPIDCGRQLDRLQDAIDLTITRGHPSLRDDPEHLQQFIDFVNKRQFPILQCAAEIVVVDPQDSSCKIACGYLDACPYKRLRDVQ